MSEQSQNQACEENSLFKVMNEKISSQRQTRALRNKRNTIDELNETILPKAKNSGLKTGRWTREEHKKFIQGLFQYGNDWKLIKSLVGTRTCPQARSHAQKFFSKIHKSESISIEGVNEKLCSVKVLVNYVNNLKKSEREAFIQKLYDIQFEDEDLVQNNEKVEEEKYKLKNEINNESAEKNENLNKPNKTKNNEFENLTENNLLFNKSFKDPYKFEERLSLSLKNASLKSKPNKNGKKRRITKAENTAKLEDNSNIFVNNPYFFQTQTSLPFQQPYLCFLVPNNFNSNEFMNNQNQGQQQANNSNMNFPTFPNIPQGLPNQFIRNMVPMNYSLPIYVPTPQGYVPIFQNNMKQVDMNQFNKNFFMPNINNMNNVNPIPPNINNNNNFNNMVFANQQQQFFNFEGLNNEKKAPDEIQTKQPFPKQVNENLNNNDSNNNPDFKPKIVTSTNNYLDLLHLNKKNVMKPIKKQNLIHCKKNPLIKKNSDEEKNPTLQKKVANMKRFKSVTDLRENLITQNIENDSSLKIDKDDVSSDDEFEWDQEIEPYKLNEVRKTRSNESENIHKEKEYSFDHTDEEKNIQLLNENQNLEGNINEINENENNLVNFNEY